MFADRPLVDALVESAGSVSVAPFLRLPSFLDVADARSLVLEVAGGL